MDCIFCKIAAKEIPAKIIYEDQNIIAFDDINPITPEHILVIPKKHISSIEDITSDDTEIISAMFDAVKNIAKLNNLSKEGYRLIVNNGIAAGQEVLHLHMHILGGKKTLGPMISKG